MSENYHQRFDPFILIDKRGWIHGKMALAEMPGLLDLLYSEDGQVEFELRFGKEEKVAAICGSVVAELILRCQCCMQPIRFRVNSTVRLGVVRSLAEADLLPETYEPLLLGEDEVVVANLVQEELILSLPIIPQHDSCELSSSRQAGKIEGLGKAERVNPFAVLKNLK